MADPDEAQKTLAAFEKAYDDYLESFKAALIKNAAPAFIQGDLKAQKALNLKLSFNLVNKEALKYLKKYKKDLENGGGYIQGEWIPWLEDKAKEERSEIARIIEEGYKAGKPTGVKQKIPGGAYPKNSIAYDLQNYFNARKSHAAAVARTEIARVQSHGSVNRYQKQGVYKVIWLVFNPCPICAQYARRVYEIKDLPREVPAHVNCRCALAPVPDEVPTGPAPDQKIPEVFEREAKALPPTPDKWEVKKIKTGNKDLPEYGPNYQNGKWRNRYTRESAGEYAKDEREAASYYIGSGYVDFNNWLRNPAKTDFMYYGIYGDRTPESLIKILTTYRDHLDSAIKKTTIPEDVTSYRSTGRNFAKDLMQNGEATEKGYSSTATTFESANRFGKRDDSGLKNILVMTNKAGKPGYYVDTSENEIIKPRNTTYKLLGIEEVDNVNYGSDYYNKVRFLYCKILE